MLEVVIIQSARLHTSSQAWKYQLGYAQANKANRTIHKLKNMKLVKPVIIQHMEMKIRLNKMVKVLLLCLE